MIAAGHIAQLFGCSPAQVRAQLARNAQQLAQMASKAEASGKKVGGYTAAQLRELQHKAEAASK